MDRPAGWAEGSDAMGMSGKSSQAEVRYRRPPTSVRNLPAETAPAESGVGAEQIVPPQRGGLSGCQSAFKVDPESACNIDPSGGWMEVVPVVHRGDPRGFA